MQYIFVDFATGACCMLEIVGIAGIISLFKEPSETFRSRGTLFLRLVSHSPTLRHLARAPHSRGADLDVPSDLHPNLWPCSVRGECFWKRRLTRW